MSMGFKLYILFVLTQLLICSMMESTTERAFKKDFIGYLVASLLIIPIPLSLIVALFESDILFKDRKFIWKK